MKEAAALLAKEKGSAFVLAGGTDLLVRLRTGFIEPDLLVDIKRIAATRTIQATASGFRIGAAVSGAELARRSRWISPSRRSVRRRSTYVSFCQLRRPASTATRASRTSCRTWKGSNQAGRCRPSFKASSCRGHRSSML